MSTPVLSKLESPLGNLYVDVVYHLKQAQVHWKQDLVK